MSLSQESFHKSFDILDQIEQCLARLDEVQEELLYYPRHRRRRWRRRRG